MSSNTQKKAAERWQFGRFVASDVKWLRRYQRKLWKQAERGKK